MVGQILTFDALKTIRGNFKPSAAAEREFYSGLRKVAITSGHLVESHVEGIKLTDQKALQKALEDYSKLITPWARRHSAKLLEQVQNSNKRAYVNKSKLLGAALKLNFAEKEVGKLALSLLNEQVGLIQSIPIEAGLRAQKIAYQAVLNGSRAIPDENTLRELLIQMNGSTSVAISRAQLIAVTETARANASINQARATAVGSVQYRWHNSGDGAVRDSHRIYHGRPLQGMIFFWNKPPTLDDGMTGNPGTFPRCRCFGEAIFQDE